MINNAFYDVKKNIKYFTENFYSMKVHGIVYILIYIIYNIIWSYLFGTKKIIKTKSPDV